MESIEEGRASSMPLILTGRRQLDYLPGGRS